MIPNLPRQLLWTDKASMEEFLHEPINERLYYFYLDLKNIRCQFRPDNSALLLFNEIYYQLTKVEYEHDIDLKLDDYTQEIGANTGKEYSIVFVYEMFFAFLLLRENNSNVAKSFQSRIFHTYNSTWNERTNIALGSIIKEEKKYLVELKPHPCPVDSLESEGIQWDEITNNFNPTSIKEVLNLWSSKEEKITVLHLIEDAYKRISRRPIKMEIIMNYIRAVDFFSKMFSELGGGKKVGQKDNNNVRKSHNNMIPSNYPFVIKNDLAPVIMERITDLVKGKISPKDKMMPIRAAQDAGAIRRPTYNEIKKALGDDFISKSSFQDYTNPEKEPFRQDSSFMILKEEFRKLIA